MAFLHALRVRRGHAEAEIDQAPELPAAPVWNRHNGLPFVASIATVKPSVWSKNKRSVEVVSGVLLCARS